MDDKKNRIFACLVMAVLMLTIGIYAYEGSRESVIVTQTGDSIKWVDFNIPAEILKKACLLDVQSYESGTHLDWITLLAYAAVRGGGEYGKKSDGYIEEAAAKLNAGEETKESLAEKYQYFSYYYEAYTAVLGGMVGEYEMENENGEMEKKYGLKAFSPIAKGFAYQDYDDFGVSRSFGYKRQHLGHDMMGVIGTTLIAVESDHCRGIRLCGGAWLEPLRRLAHRYPQL